jgi:hypothetical protein
VALGAPLPAPVESTTPPPYETPGLAKAVNAEGQPLVAQPAAPPSIPELNLAETFKAQGQVYGAPSGPLVLQALKPAFLVVRGGDGTIYFARQLALGEAFRAPAIGGLTVDVSEPEAFQVFVSGQSKGLLPKPLSDVSGLVGAPPAPKTGQPGQTPAPAKPAAAQTSAPGGKPAAAKPAAATQKPAVSAQKPAAAPPKPAAKPKPKPDADEDPPAT